MAELPESHLIFEKLGDINATLREVKHATNQNSMKIDGLAQIVAMQGAISEKVDGLILNHEKHHLRIQILETDRHRREGAIGLVAWLGRNWPVAVIIAAIAGVITWFTNIKVG